MNVKSKLRALYAMCSKRHGLLFASLVLIFAQLLTRGMQGLNVFLSKNVIRPLHFTLSKIFSIYSFSFAELLIALFSFGIIAYIVFTLYKLVRHGERLKRLYKAAITLLSVGFAIYAGFCLLWGVYYYGDDFISANSTYFKQQAISVEELEAVTAHFAKLANEYADKVERDKKGGYNADRDVILEKSAYIYDNIAKEIASLEGPAVRAKGIKFSRIMSYTDFTGFFFPFTAEANVNTDFPVPLFASTVAHELAHQRGVAKEQEANFVAVIASFESMDTDYCYSAALLAYTYLGNALYSADYDAWYKIYSSLNENVKDDLLLGNAYWQAFKTPVKTASNKIYEGFLQSYDQKLGLKSYGACVDLLVNYYIDKI